MTTTFDYGELRSADIRVDANTEGCLGGDPVLCQNSALLK